MRPTGLFVVSVLALGACKTEVSPHAGRYVLDREGMKVDLEKRLEGLAPEEQKAARELLAPLIDAVDVTLDLESGGDGVVTTRKITVTGDEKVVSDEKSYEFEWTEQPDGSLVLDGEDQSPSTCTIADRTMTCTNASEQGQVLIFVRP